jgi:hypothetical protein
MDNVFFRKISNLEKIYIGTENSLKILDVRSQRLYQISDQVRPRPGVFRRGEYFPKFPLTSHLQRSPI